MLYFRSSNDPAVMRTLPIENREEIDRIITSCKTCFLAMSDEGNPYVVPMNFALDGDCVILHSGQSGRKWETLRRNPRVCLHWMVGEELLWQDESVGCSYRVGSKTVLAEGIAGFVEEYAEKERCMHKLMAQYSSLTFRFGKPSIDHVGVIRVRIGKISARDFGAKTLPAGKTTR